MKKYLEYPLNEGIQKELEKYYENTKLKQHSGQDKKSNLFSRNICLKYLFKPIEHSFPYCLLIAPFIEWHF